MTDRCKHVRKTGKNPGGQCTRKACDKYNGFCYNHKKRVVDTDLTKDEVFGQPAGATPEPKASAEKLRFSVWRWTLNSQQDFTKMSADQKLRFKNLIEHIFEAPDVARYLIDSNNEDPTKNLRDIKSEFYFEVGGDQHRLHVHGFISIAHTGHYRLGLERVQGTCARVLGHKIHFTAQAAGDPNKAWEMYIQKAQQSQPVEL